MEVEYLTTGEKGNSKRKNMGDYFQTRKGILPLGMQNYWNSQVHREGIRPKQNPLTLQIPNITPTWSWIDA